MEEETLDVAEETAQTESTIDLDEVIEVDNPEADFNVPVAPPKAGDYNFRWKLNAQKPGGGIDPKHSDKVGNFLNVHLIGSIVAPDETFDGYLVNDYMNTIVNKQKGTSEVHHFGNCLGTPLEKTMSLRQIMDKLREELSVEPTSRATLEWKATIKDPKEKSGYKDIANKMTAFPRDENSPSGYQNWIESPIDGEKVYAQAYIVKHKLPND